MNLSVHIQPKTDFIFQPHNRTNIQEWAPNLTKNTPKIGLKMGHIQDWDPRVFFIVNYRGGGRFQEKKLLTTSHIQSIVKSVDFSPLNDIPNPSKIPQSPPLPPLLSKRLPSVTCFIAAAS